MDVSDTHMQEILDRRDWSCAANLYRKAAFEKIVSGEDEAAGFLMTHALVYAYLAGDGKIVGELENKLRDLDRL